MTIENVTCVNSRYVHDLDPELMFASMVGIIGLEKAKDVVDFAHYMKYELEKSGSMSKTNKRESKDD